MFKAPNVSNSIEAGKFLINGAFATVVHFAVLWSCLNVFGFSSAGLSNLFASVIGIVISFFGNRYFVFQSFEKTLSQQFSKFAGIYICIALVHGFLLFFLTDYLNIDYRVGFIFAVFIQVSLGYLGSKFFVF